MKTPTTVDSLEKCVSQEARRQKVSDGDQKALRAYVGEHCSGLEEAVGRLRASADAFVAAAMSFVPRSTAEWLDWIDAHEDLVHAVLSTALQIRKPVGARVQAMGNLKAGPRILPKCKDSHAPLWKQLNSGMYCFRVAKGVQLVAFVAGIGYTMWAWPPLVREGTMELELRLDVCFHMHAQPLVAVLRTWFGEVERDVFQIG